VRLDVLLIHKKGVRPWEIVISTGSDRQTLTFNMTETFTEWYQAIKGGIEIGGEYKR
jgi:hypothetical protein